MAIRDRVASFLGITREAAKPFAEQGVSGAHVQAGYVVSVERNASLNGANRWRTYDDIAVNVPVVAASIRYFTALVTKAAWSAKAVDSTNQEALDAAEFVKHAMDAVEQPWSQIVARAVTARFHGFSVQEWTAKRDADGLVLFAGIENRPQSSVERWDLDANGTVVGIVQRGGDGREVYLPRSKCIYLVDSLLTDSPAGMGVLRHCVEPATRLKAYQVLEQQGFERDLRGIPVGRAPFGAINDALAAVAGDDSEEGKALRAQVMAPIETLRQFVAMQIKGKSTGLIMDSTPWSSPSESQRETFSSQKQWDIELLQGPAPGLKEKRTAEQLADVIASYDDRVFAATNTDQLAAFDRAAQKEREAELKAGGAAMADLERALGAERLAIVRQMADEMAEAVARYDDRTFDATNSDPVAASDRELGKERLVAAKLGGEALVAFERMAAAERAQIVKASAEAVRETLQTDAVNRYTAAVNARGEAENVLRTEFQRTVDYVAGLRDFLRDMRLDENTSTLSGQARFDEAQATFRDLLFKANGGDRDAQDQLLAASQDYLDQAKAYWASSETYGDVFREVESALKASASKAETQLDVVKRQASSLVDIAENTKGLSALLKEYLDARATAEKAFQGVNDNRIWESAGSTVDRNKHVVAELAKVGVNYTGNFGNGLFNAWRATQSPANDALITSILARYDAMNRGAGYASGGYTGAGGVNERAGFVHKGEVVWSQENVRAWGGPAKVEAMRTRLQPDPYPASSSRAAMPPGTDGLLAEIRRTNALLEQLKASNARGHIDNIQATREGTDAVRNLVEQEKRRSAA